MSSELEPAIRSHDTGQQIPRFDRCQLAITWMSNIKDAPCIDLAKSKSGAPWLFILTACMVNENKKFRIVRVLMVPVPALIIKSFSLLSSIEKLIA